MEKPLMPAHPQRSDTWTSDMTYHSLYQEDDVKKTFISSHSVEDPYPSSEKRKVVLGTRISWIHPLVHLLPVFATAAVVQLTFRKVYWADESSYYKDWQTILQFPAKIHELLIVGSLSAMVLHIFRRMLISSNGIPLGLMVGAFQISSAEYLFSKSYWKPLIHSFHSLNTWRNKQLKTFLVALALGCCIVYSFLVGPASAAALLPTLGWWDMDKPFNDSLPMNSYISRGSSELYPMTLQTSSIYENCLLPEYWNALDCPAGGFRALTDWAWTRAQEGYWYNVTDSQHYNPTMSSSFSGQAQRAIVTGLAASNSSTTVALSATLHASVLALTDSFWHYISSNVVGEVNKAQKPKFTIPLNKGVSIPLVQVQCQSYNLGVALRRNSTLSFDTSAMVNDFSKSESNAYSWVKWNVPNGAWNFAHPQPWNMTDVRWIDASEIKGTHGEPLPSSLAAVVTIPAVWEVADSNGTSGYQQGSVITPCVIDARWATTDVIFDVTDPVVKTSLTTWLDKTNLIKTNVNVKSALSKWKISDPISISQDWASTIDNLPLVGGSFMEQILYQFESPFSYDERLLSFFPSSSSDEPWEKVYANSIAVVISTVMADWISRASQVGTDFTTVLSPVKDGNVSTIDLLSQRSTTAISSTPNSTFDDQTGIVYTVQRYGWGYGLKSKTVWFSIISLLIHVALVVVYFLYSFVFWYRANGWTSKSWGTIGELLALAAVSPPADEFRNTGGGIANSKTWMTAMRVREADSDSECLELIVGTRGGTVVPGDNKLRIDKPYS